MVDTLQAGTPGDLYYEYYHYQDMHLCPIAQDGYGKDISQFSSPLITQYYLLIREGNSIFIGTAVTRL